MAGKKRGSPKTGGTRGNHHRRYVVGNILHRGACDYRGAFDEGKTANLGGRTNPHALLMEYK